MLHINKKRILSLSTVALICSLTAAICIYYYPSFTRGPIYAYDAKRDYDDIVELFELERFLLTSTPDYSPEFMLKYMSPHKWNPQYRGKLHVDVLRPDNVFTGFTAYYMERAGEGRVLFLAIRPEMRGKGYGKKLTLHAISALKKLGASNVKIVTRTGNLSAQKVYGSVGFNETLRDNLEGYVSYEMTP
jgi:ribosomal protein S18 acetylase RimI-like enzyme